MLLGDFKQELMRINNKVNMEVFHQGLRWQKVEILQDKVLIIANNKRVAAMTTLDPKVRVYTQLIDIAWIIDFKERFINYVEESMKVKVLAHLKDYDPLTEISFSVTIFEKSIDELLKEL